MDENSKLSSHDKYLDIECNLDFLNLNEHNDNDVMTKPHFLDYDSVPPAGYESNGSTVDYFNFGDSSITKSKHFLDENPIPPDYMVTKPREHRSLDRNVERVLEYNSKQSDFRTQSLTRTKETKTWPSTRSINDNDETAEYLHSSMPTKIFEESQQLGSKIACVYSLISMLGSNDVLENSEKFLELSNNRDTCTSLRNSGCVPVLVQMMQSEIQSKEGYSNKEISRRAISTLQNIAQSNLNEKAGRRELKVLRLIEQLLDYCSFLKTLLQSGGEAIADATERHPLAAISSMMKVSFDEEHRHTMCMLGSLQIIAHLVHLDHAVHGPKPGDQCCNSLRRFALMSLTNLTFGDDSNKALLCSNKQFMEALVAQLDFAPDDLLQVTASVLRNLSWRVDDKMKKMLHDIGTITALTKAAMKNENENTLKAILSALWNLSAHCSQNKAEFCSVDGSLSFLVTMLQYEGPSKSLKITENAGGILRNVSSHIAVSDTYRQILREKNCLSILLQQLKSESLTVVSNSCGTLWNLSARCPEDQKFLWDNGAVPMLRSLIHSKHKLISEGSSAALKNLVNFRPGSIATNSMDSVAKSMGLKELPSLNARKQKALEEVLDKNLSETCENNEITTPLNEKKSFSSNFQCKLYKGDDHLSKSKSSKLLMTSSSMEFELNGKKNDISNSAIPKPRNYSAYQETDLDQPTNFSLRYTENENLDNEIEKNDDTIKCYQTEDTPYISKAPSIGDLRKDGKTEIFTPEKPINYFEEGTPDKCSRRHSISSLDETMVAKPLKTNFGEPTEVECEQKKKPSNSALETPLMFSRRSSMDSIEEDGQLVIDDKISEVSDFSRLASGIVSPSEIPDSPTQSLPGTPGKQVHIASNNIGSPSKETSNSKMTTNTSNTINNRTILNDNVNLTDTKVCTLSDEEEDDYSGDLLANCINLGMNKKKNDKPSAGFNDAVITFHTEDTPALSKAGSISNLSRAVDCSDVTLLEQYHDIPKQHENIEFEQCNPLEMLKSGGHFLTSYPSQNTEDELKKFLVEDSPCNFSVISGLSHLTVDSEKIEIASKRENKLCEMEKVCEGSISSLSNESDDDNKLLVQAIEAGFNRQKEIIEKAVYPQKKCDGKSFQSTSSYCVQSQLNDSISSLDSSDDNQSKSLFEQCILSGMNKQRRIIVGQPSSSDSDVNIRHDLKNSMSSVKKSRDSKKYKNKSEDELLYDCIKVGMTNSKNVETTSVAVLEQSEKMGHISLNSAPNIAPGVETRTKTHQNGTNKENPNLLLQQEIIGFEYEEDDEKTITDSSLIQKQKDPNLMLRSVERLTKNFMSTAENLRNTEYSQNNSSNNTWSDDYCPNGISFPIVSQAGPDLDDYDQSLSLTECNEDISNDLSNILDFKLGGEVSVPCNINSYNKNLDSSSNLTNSIIANEANLIANNIMCNLSNSTQSLDIDHIRPPSCMESINFSGCFDHLQSPKLSNMRKKSLPSGIIAKRALGFSSNASTRNGSIENISCTYNIENINPPSIIDDLMDSMISVSSIQSEVFEGSYESRYETACETMSSIDMDNTFDDNTITLQSCMDQIPNLPNDDATPIPSDISSGESTPKKSLKNLTSQQRRQNSKDRYKTYTITPELWQNVLLSQHKQIKTMNEDLTIINTLIRSEPMDSFDSIEKSVSSNSTVISEHPTNLNILNFNGNLDGYNSFEKSLSSNSSLYNGKDSDNSNDHVGLEKDSGTDMVYSSEDVPNIPKPIYGRKKPPYISPYRQKPSSISRSTPSKTANLKAKQTKPKEKEKTELIRQSTFVKDEPTNEDVPVVEMVDNKKTNYKIKSANISDKTNNLAKKNNIRISSIPKVSGPKRSNSNTVIRVTPSVKLNKSSIPSTQPPSRSNSTLTKFSSTKLNQIGSKISGIWKNNRSNTQINASTTNNNIKNKIINRSNTFSNEKKPVSSPTKSNPQKDSPSSKISKRLSYQTPTICARKL